MVHFTCPCIEFDSNVLKTNGSTSDFVSSSEDLLNNTSNFSNKYTVAYKKKVVVNSISLQRSFTIASWIPKGNILLHKNQNSKSGPLSLTARLFFFWDVCKLFDSCKEYILFPSTLNKISSWVSRILFVLPIKNCTGFDGSSTHVSCRNYHPSPK